MPTFTYTTPIELSRLHDEIMAAVPATQPIVSRGERVPVMHLEQGGGVTSITVPDGVTKAEINAVVRAHKRPKQAHEYRAEYATATDARKLEIIARTLGIEAPELVGEDGDA